MAKEMATHYRIEDDVEKIDETMLKLLDEYVHGFAEDGDYSGEPRLLGTVHLSENTVTAAHLLEDADMRALYFANKKYYLDNMGNLYRGTNSKGRYVGSLEMQDVRELMA